MIRSLVAYLSILACATLTQAAVIVSYNLQGTTGDQAVQTPALQAPNTTGLNLTRGPGLVASAAGNSFSASGWESSATPATSDEFFQFGFTVAPGYAVDVTQLYLGTRSSNTGPGTVGVFVSTNNFSTSTQVATISQAPGTNFVNSIISLNSLPDLTGNVLFRIYEIGNTSANGSVTASTGTFRVTAYFSGGVFDRDFQILGDVKVVPEAPSIILGFVGACACVVMVRIRRRASA